VKPTVVMLLSDKRSGSTLVQTELCRHRDVRHVDFSTHSLSETHYWVKAALVLGLPEDRFSGGAYPTSYGSRQSAFKSLESNLSGNLPGFEPGGQPTEWVIEGWEALCRKYAQPVFFEKSPQHIHHPAALDLIRHWAGQTGFTTRFIGLVRNPMAVMHSAERQFASDPAKRQFGWLEGCRNLAQFAAELDANQYFLLRYEELLEQPHATFGELCRFIGIEPIPSMGDSVRSDNRDAWRTDRGYMLELAPDVIQFARELGYPEQDLERAPGSEVNRFRRRARALGNALRRTRGRAYYRLKRWQL